MTITPEKDAYRLRLANANDGAAITMLIQLSARGLSQGYYPPEQVEAALQGAFGLDSQLIADGTYFVVVHAEPEAGETIVACGGWSFRRTMFGGDKYQQRDAELLDPQRDAAKIRAFFVHPEHSRHGLGRRILSHSEQQARERGFARCELMSTLPGVPFYRRQGYLGEESIDYPLNDTVSIRFVPMSKAI